MVNSNTFFFSNLTIADNKIKCLTYAIPSVGFHFLNVGNNSK